MVALLNNNTRRPLGPAREWVAPRATLGHIPDSRTRWGLYRLYLNRAAMATMGEPERIAVGWEPKTRCLLLRPATKFPWLRAHRINGAAQLCLNMFGRNVLDGFPTGRLPYFLATGDPEWPFAAGPVPKRSEAT